MTAFRKNRLGVQITVSVLLFSAAAVALFVGLMAGSGRISAPAWAGSVSYVLAAAAAVLWVWSLLLFPKGAPKEGKKKGFGILLSPLLADRSPSQRVAYVGVTAALCVAVNLFEFRFADVQFSLTVFASVLAGMLIGPFLGFAAVFLGDAIGFLGNPAGTLYMPWVGLSVATMSLIAGLVMRIPLKFKGSGYVKLVLICILTLTVCSVGINTTGMYFYYTRVGFSQKSLALLAERFGGANNYFTYALVRLLFLGQLWNSLFNYALLFAAVPVLNAAKPLKIKIS